MSWKPYIEGHLRLRKPKAKLRDRKCADLFIPEEVDLLHRWGLIEVSDGEPVWPGNGTMLALWDDCEDRIIVDNTAGEYWRFRHVRSALCGVVRRSSDTVISKLIEWAGGQPVTVTLVTQLLGKAAAGETAKRARELQNMVQKAVPIAGHASLEELLEIFPEAARAPILEAMEQEVLPPIRPPDAPHMARVLRLCGEAARALGACQLLRASIDRRSPGTAYWSLGRAERFDDITIGLDQRCEAAVAKALGDYAAGALRPFDTEIMRLRTASGHNHEVRSARAFVQQTFGPAADAVLAMLPALHPAESVFTKPMRARLKAITKASVEKKADERLLLVPKLSGLLIACENRVGQLNGLVTAYLKALKGGSPRLERGDTAGFHFRGPVVRPDGTLGVGEQTIWMRMVREADLVRDALARDKGDAALAALLARIEADPVKSAQISLVYDRTAPIAPGGEWHEPWCVDLERCNVFGSPVEMSEGLSERRRDLLKAMGRPKGFTIPEGLLAAHYRRRWTVDACRMSDPQGRNVVVPLLEFFHAMLCARIVLRMSVRWGARIAETRQLRSGCIQQTASGGKWKMTARLKPKGWMTEADFDVDDDTVDAMAELKLIAHYRWFVDCLDEHGDLSVPIVAYLGRSQRNLFPARYILQGPNGMISEVHLANFLRVLLSGVVNMASHDGRFLFATAMGLGDATEEAIGSMLHHRPGSSQTSHYNLSQRILAFKGTESFNQHIDMLMFGKAIHAWSAH